MEREPLRVALISLGCPKNLVDSERMLAQLAEGGCLVPAPLDDADVAIVNTCGFLDAARQEAMEVIGEVLDLKRQGQLRRVIVAGCLVNRDAEGLYEQAPDIDAIIGVNNRDDVLSAVTGQDRISRTDTCPSNTACSDLGRFRVTPHHTSYLRISEGCSHGCTFCTIPAIRGPFRSKAPQQVLAEARELIADGCRELNLIAQDTTNYGADLDGEWNLARLLRDLNALDGADWIRLLYAYPNRFDDALIDAISKCQHVLPYVDMPLQHINDDVLRRMGRRTTRAKIESLLGKLRERIPGMAIRTTFIVGFPGETEEQFAELLDFVRSFRFDAMGVFAYSPEEGTPAADMGEQIDETLRSEREGALMLAQQDIATEAGDALVGSGIEVLVDGVDERGASVGRSKRQAPDIDGICYLTEPREAGDVVAGTVIEADEYDLIVEPNLRACQPVEEVILPASGPFIR